MDKCGLVLEGGGMRGVFTSGVLDYFLDNNIKFDGVIGVSAGCLNATRYLSNQPKKSLEVTLDNLNNKDYCSIHSLIKTKNIFGVDLLYNKIPRELVPLDNDYFKKSKIPFYCVATNCDTGLPEYFMIKDFFKDMEYMRASSSLPALSTKVLLNNKYYLDGGISDSIPVIKSIQLGFNKNVIVLTQPPEYRKKQTKTYKIFKRVYKDNPNLVDAVKDRHIMYNNTLEYINKAKENGTVFVIQPKESLGVGRTEKNKDKILSAYKNGYETAALLHKDLIEFMKKDTN